MGDDVMMLHACHDRWFVRAMAFEAILFEKQGFKLSLANVETERELLAKSNPTIIRFVLKEKSLNFTTIGNWVRILKLL